MIKKQIVTVVAVVAVMGYLYLQPVKGLVKPKEERAAPGKQATAGPVASKINVAAVSVPAKTAIGADLAGKITSLEDALKKAESASEKIKLQTELAHEWDNVNQPAPAAFYYMDLAQAKNDFENWFTAGSRFNDAYKFTQDTTMQPTFVSNAILSFKKAAALRPADLESKTGLGVAYVNQTSLGITDPDGGSPMQGIMLLREVVGADPDNWNANLNLGQFAMKSGQYQKAVERFKHMIALDNKRSKVEPYFYLAESYKQLGMKKEAIDAYVKCKEMMGDPAMGQTIDNYINELKN
jgi:tetratricopeptide (TPR) repeat protein